MTERFLPLLTFRIERQVVRTPHAVKAWLIADVSKNGVRWSVQEEHYVNRGIVQGHVKFEGPFIREKADRFLSFRPDLAYDLNDERRELFRRAAAVNANALLAAACRSPTSESADLVWIVFNAMYYPAEVEDVQNGWIRDAFPELHDERMGELRRENMRTVRDVYDV